MISIYKTLTYVLASAGLPFAAPFILFFPKWRKSFRQRLGFGSLPRPKNQNKPGHSGKGPIWVHALSVGEVLSALPLVKEIKHRHPEKEIFFSATTRTGFEIAWKMIGESVDCLFFFPFDLPGAVARRLGQISPSMVIIVETDIWPNFLFETRRRDIPVILVNARLSEKSFSGYKKFNGLIRPAMEGFSRICVQSPADAKRFRDLGVLKQKIRLTGNLKFDQPDPCIGRNQSSFLKASLKIDPESRIMVMGSTHPEEEPILLESFLKIREIHKNTILIVAPRDHRRASKVSTLFASAGFSSKTLSPADEDDHDKITDVIVVDKIGMLRDLYGIADIAFVGGSLAELGGHNPLEPAAWAKPVLFGPHMTDFSDVSELLVQAGGAEKIHDAATLAKAASGILGNNARAQAMGTNARDVFSRNKGAMARVLESIDEVSDSL